MSEPNPSDPRDDVPVEPLVEAALLIGMKRSQFLGVVRRADSYKIAMTSAKGGDPVTIEVPFSRITRGSEVLARIRHATSDFGIRRSMKEAWQDAADLLGEGATPESADDQSTPRGALIALLEDWICDHGVDEICEDTVLMSPLIERNGVVHLSLVKLKDHLRFRDERYRTAELAAMLKALGAEECRLERGGKRGRYWALPVAITSQWKYTVRSAEKPPTAAPTASRGTSEMKERWAGRSVEPQGSN